MKDVLISPLRDKGDPHISGPVLFFVNPAETAIVANTAKERKARRHFLFNSNLFELENENTSYWAGPALGAPMAVMCLEKLIAMGARQVVVYGWCGSLVNSMKTGDIFMPTWGHSEEGTSSHYPLPYRPESNPSLRQQLCTYLQERNLSCRQGPIWTTDAPYRETYTKVEKYAKEGIMAVDMEYSALCTVASFRKIHLCAVMLVSDELRSTPWKPGFKQKSFKVKNRTLLLETAAFLHSGLLD
ncbi:MAG: nucleoside phosphorylase [Desulfobulbaceae bacterium]|nr:nucleoside phosphorylase [Desulfobulbaceae bacterium]